MNCRHCSAELTQKFVELGCAPPSNAYLTKTALKRKEKYYSLTVMVCDQCWLVQTLDFVGADELFSEEYAYFSSFSESWLEHAKNYVRKTVRRFGLTRESNFVEIAANDGYLLQFVKEHGIPCYGIEPTESTARAAREKGIDIIEAFFNVRMAKELVGQGRQSDLIVANNVLAHVPDINDFVKGISILLKSNGVATFEFPHFLNLTKYNQFDTIYHEHYSYLSFSTAQAILQSNGLNVFDVEEIPTHGGSLRVYAQRSDFGKYEVSETVNLLSSKEQKAGICTIDFYEGFQDKAEEIKLDFLSFLTKCKKNGKKIVGYGAAAKGSTLLNFANVKPDLLSCIADKNPVKQGKYMPGSRIPIVKEDQIRIQKADYIIIFPWNLKQEIMSQLDYVRKWGGLFVTAIPTLNIE